MFVVVADCQICLFSAFTALSVVLDASNPVLKSFSLNTELMTLTLNFSEVVNSSSLGQSEIVLQNSPYMNSSSQNVSVYDWTNIGVAYSSSIILQLSIANIFGLQAQSNLGTDVNNTYLVLYGGGISDVTGNPAVSVVESALPASIVVPDTLPPVVAQFDLNMSDGTLAVQFSKIMQEVTLNYTYLYMQDSQNQPQVAISLATLVWVASVDNVIVFQIHHETLNDIKANSLVGTDKDNTFLSFDATFISDTSGKQMDAFV